MAKKSLLLVDADPRSLRVLEVSLRKAGYEVATSRDAERALELVERSSPDLILSDTRLPEKDGFALVQALRARRAHEGIAIMFLSSDGSVGSKVRGLELGVEDYLVKPIYIRELVTRIHLALQRQTREGLARRSTTSKTRFTGSLSDMGLVDLLQTVEISRKSGVLELTNHAQRGSISFRDGQLVDAEAGRLRAESAMYRLLLWSEGEFEIDFRPVQAEQRMTSSIQALLMEGMRRLDEWGRLLEQLPSLEHVFAVSERLAAPSDGPLRFIDGCRSLAQVVDACEGDDLESLTAITKLYLGGSIYPTGRTLRSDLGAGTEARTVLPLPNKTLPDDDGEELPSLIPRARTWPPPEAKSHSLDRVSIDIPEASLAPSELACAALDTGSARIGALESHRPEIDSYAARHDAADDPAPPGSLRASHPEPESPDEDGSTMAKKGKRSRKVRATGEELEVQRSEAEREASNVIQFPAQAKRVVVSSTQVVVGDLAANDGARVEADDEPLRAAADAGAAVSRGAESRLLPSTEAAPERVEEGTAAGDEPSADEPDEPASEPDAPANPASRTERVTEAKPSSSLPPPDRGGKKKKGKHRDASRAPLAPPSTSAPPKAKSTPSVASTGEHQAVADDFFNGSAPLSESEDDDWEDLQRAALPMAPGMKRAMHATFAIVGAGVLAIGVFLLYTNVWMPRPVELVGSSRPPELAELPIADEREPAPAPIDPPAPSAAAVEPEEASPAGSPEPGALAPEPSAAAPEPEAAAPEPEAAAPEPLAAAPEPEAAAPEPAPPEPPPAPPAAVAAPEPPAPAVPAPAASGEDGAALARQALRALNRGRNDEAASLAERAVQADSTSALGWLVLGYARQARRDAVGAREAYRSCVEQGADARYVRECRPLAR